MVLFQRQFAAFNTLVMVLATFCGISLFAEPEPPLLRATWGAAEHGYESTLAQQVEYLKKTLPVWLAGWNLELVPQSIAVDAARDRNGRNFVRYYYGDRKQVVYYPYNLRTAHFTVKNSRGWELAASLILVEQVEGVHKEALKFNSTQETFLGLAGFVNGRSITLALTDSTNSKDFGFELDRYSLKLRPKSDRMVEGASSEKKLSYLHEQLDNFLSPSSLRVVPSSLNINFYYDYGLILAYPERYGQMVNFLVENPAGQRQIGYLSLWENHSGHQAKLGKCNSTLTAVESVFSGSPGKLVLSHGYNEKDLEFELDPSSLSLRPASVR